MERQHNSLRIRVVVKQRQQRVSEALGLGNAGLRYLHKGNKGVQGGPSTILKRTPRHRACAVGAVHTSVHCAESYGIGQLLHQGMSARISHGAKKRGPRRAISNIIWIEMDTDGDIHCNHE